MLQLFLVFIISMLSVPSWANIPREALHHRAELTREARMVWGLNAPVATFAAQIHQESRWRANALSPVGAQGLTQFMPQTSKWIAQAYPNTLGNAQPSNPTWAMRAMVTYNKWLWDRVSAQNSCERMAMTLSSYNGGLGWIAKDKNLAEKRGLNSRVWFDNVETVNSGRNASAFKENRGYPRIILLKYEPTYIQNGFGVGVCNG